MKTIFIGSVMISKEALETLIECGVKIDMIFSIAESHSKNISDYYPIHEIAEKHSIPYKKFVKLNDQDIISEIRSLAPDFIFVIGISQIVGKEILDSAKKYVVGFHPTALPKMRGRAAIPWQIILGIQETAVTLLKLDEGMDSGDIIGQHPYVIQITDYALDIYTKVGVALKQLLKRCIPNIYDENVRFIKQNEKEATFLLVRRPEDGKIDWTKTGKEIHTLIRAASKPYPGAFAYYKGIKVVIWRADLRENDIYHGMPGQIAYIDKSGDIVITAGDSILVVKDYEIVDGQADIRAGNKFS